MGRLGYVLSLMGQMGYAKRFKSSTKEETGQMGGKSSENVYNLICCLITIKYKLVVIL